MKFVLSYHITDEDYLAFNEHHIRCTTFGRKAVRNGRIGLIALCLIILCFFWFQHNDRLVFLFQCIAVGLVCLLETIFFPRSMMKFTRRKLKKGQKTGKELFSPRGELTVDFENGIIVDKTEKMTLEIPFSSVQQWHETETAFYIYIQPQGGFILPYHDFFSSDDLRSFREIAQKTFPNNRSSESKEVSV